MKRETDFPDVTKVEKEGYEGGKESRRMHEEQERVAGQKGTCSWHLKGERKA